MFPFPRTDRPRRVPQVPVSGTWVLGLPFLIQSTTSMRTSPGWQVAHPSQVGKTPGPHPLLLLHKGCGCSLRVPFLSSKPFCHFTLSLSPPFERHLPSQPLLSSFRYRITDIGYPPFFFIDNSTILLYSTKCGGRKGVSLNLAPSAQARDLHRS